MSRALGLLGLWFLGLGILRPTLIGLRRCLGGLLFMF